MRTAAQMLQTLRINHSVATHNAQYATENRMASQPLTFGATPEQIAARVQYVYAHDDTITKMSEARAQVVSELQALLPAPLATVTECPERGAHVFCFVKEQLDGAELWRCACGQDATDARERGLLIDPEDESEWVGHRLPIA